MAWPCCHTGHKAYRDKTQALEEQNVHENVHGLTIRVTKKKKMSVSAKQVDDCMGEDWRGTF